MHTEAKSKTANITKRCVLQFAKWPIPGHVKTRLAKEIGDDKALQAHIELMSYVAKALSGVEGVRHTVYFDRELGSPPPGWLLALNDCAPDIGFARQSGDDLGARMLNAAHENLAVFDSVVIVGSDCPSVDRHYVEAAFEKLRDHDLVLGPAEDGGYVLIGFSRIEAGLFNGLIWGSDQVLKQTSANASRLGMTLALLDVRWDVDEYEDFIRWKSSV